MTEFLGDPIWQFIITVIIAVATVLVSIFLALKQRKRKELSYEVLALTPLLSAKKEYRAKLKMYFEDKPVEQVHLVAVRILNSGNVPITSNDYERSLNLRFSEEAEILSVEVANTSPASLKESVGTRILDSRNGIIVSPSLLNEDDSITFNMLVNKLEGEVTVDGRIVGVKEIGKLKLSVSLSEVRSLALAYSIATIVALGSLTIVPMILPFFIVVALMLGFCSTVLFLIIVSGRFRRFVA